MSTNKVIERIYIKGDLEVISPISIGSGNDKNTDKDVMVDSFGRPYLPGTSLAGVFRSYLADYTDFSNESMEIKYLFGHHIDIKNKFDSTISNIFISDAYPLNDVDILVRDGIKIDERFKSSVSGSKFNYEVVSPNTVFQLRMEVIIRENFEYFHDGELKSHKIDPTEIKKLLGKLLYALENEKISIGAKTNRGYGLVKLINTQIEVIGPNDYERFIEFDFSNLINNSSYHDWYKGEDTLSYIDITADLAIESSLMIRSYSFDPEQLDQIMIRVGDKPVIPGTSWGGALRNHALKLVRKLGLSERIVDHLFGNIDTNNNEETIYSRVRTYETYFESINKEDYHIMRRTKINRVSGSAANRALFDEEYLARGTAKFRLGLERSKEKYLGLLLLLIDEINNGFLPIGGETSIGRGLVKLSNIMIDGQSLTDKDKEKYLDAFISTVKGVNYELN